jgi:hypothetical protein
VIGWLVGGGGKSTAKQSITYVPSPRIDGSPTLPKSKPIANDSDAPKFGISVPPAYVYHMYMSIFEFERVCVPSVSYAGQFGRRLLAIAITFGITTNTKAIDTNMHGTSTNFE